MRALIALSIVQTVLLGLIGLRVLSVDARMNTVTDTSLDVLTATARLNQSGDRSSGSLQTAQSSLTADDVRWIIQEELAAFADQTPDTSQPRAAQNNSNSARAVENGENRYGLKADVQQELDYFIGRGNINQNEMANLQIKIARLPPSERGEMLSRLTKSLSAGEIDGQF